MLPNSFLNLSNRITASAFASVDSLKGDALPNLCAGLKGVHGGGRKEESQLDRVNVRR